MNKQFTTKVSTSEWGGRLDQVVDSIGDSLIQVRRHLHAYPEPSGEEVKTTRYLAERLADTGLEPRFGPGDRGLIVDGGTGSEPSNSRIGLRADIDALRIQDSKSVDYRSRVSGVMHACGHDAHAATVLGAFIAINKAASEGVLPWPVQLRAIFQPAEETCVGALEMVEAGAIEGLQALLALHMDPTRPLGDIGVRKGAFTADCDEIRIHIAGQGGHASRPHESVDPIAAAAQLINSIYLFVPRAIDSHLPVVVTIGKISGGENYNVIPDHVDLLGTMRSFGGEVRQRTMDHIQQLARGIAEASGTSIDVSFHAGPPSVYNDHELSDLIESSAAEMLGADHIQTIERPSMGGEDFANYLGHVRGCMFRLGCVPAELIRAGSAPALHSSNFDIDDKAIVLGARILARAVVNWSNPQEQPSGS